LLLHGLATSVDTCNKQAYLVAKLRELKCRSSACLQVPGAHTFAQILEYIYTGKCITHEGDLISMLEAAHYLQIDPLLRALQDLVARRVDSSNCLEAWSVADRYALEKLSATAMQMALRSFEQVVASPAFLSMPIAFVRALISDDKLIAREEQPVFEAVIRWLHGQESSTFEEQQSLLTLVRFPLLPHYYVISRVQREPIILRHPMGLGLLLESYQQRVYELPDSSLHRRRLGQMPRGVLRPVPSEILIGWEKHFEVPYSQRTQPSDLTSVPDRATHIFIGARAPDGQIALGAMGAREAILRRTLGNETHENNGVHWYFASNEDGEDTSFGFSRAARVDLSNADVLGSGWMENPKDEDGRYRLSWHLDEESVPGAGGWRAGHEIDLHEGTGDSWMKLMYFACM